MNVSSRRASRPAHPAKEPMAHRHFCDFAGHWWDCGGTALRLGETVPSVCVCPRCRLPLEGSDHRACEAPVELRACPEHVEQQRQRMEEARERHERRAAEFGFDEKWRRMKALPDGPEKDALAGEIVEWLFSEPAVDEAT